MQCSEGEYLYSGITTSRPATTELLHYAAAKVFQYVWKIANGVSMRYEVPASCAISVVVQPGAEDQICCDEQEDPTHRQYVDGGRAKIALTR